MGVDPSKLLKAVLFWLFVLGVAICGAWAFGPKWGMGIFGALAAVVFFFL